MSFPPNFTPLSINTRNDGRIAGRPTNTNTPITITATHGFYEDNTAMIAQPYTPGPAGTGDTHCGRNLKKEARKKMGGKNGKKRRWARFAVATLTIVQSPQKWFIKPNTLQHALPAGTNKAGTSGATSSSRFI